jgi:hypothetical protein
MITEILVSLGRIYRNWMSLNASIDPEQARAITLKHQREIFHLFPDVASQSYSQWEGERFKY